MSSTLQHIIVFAILLACVVYVFRAFLQSTGMTDKPRRSSFGRCCEQGCDARASEASGTTNAAASGDRAAGSSVSASSQSNRSGTQFIPADDLRRSVRR
jgi:hypothetical protein